MCFDRGSLYECFQESRKFEDDGSAESNSECRRVTAGRTGKRAVRLDLVYDFSLIQVLIELQASSFDIDCESVYLHLLYRSHDGSPRLSASRTYITFPRESAGHLWHFLT